MKYPVGAMIYKYRLESFLGKGEFGEVWQVFDITLQKVVALKIIESPLPADILQTLKEAVIGNQLQHENLMPIYSADVTEYGENTLTLIAQEYLASGAVTNHLTAGNFMTIPNVVSTMMGVLRGLDYLHHANIFHNDIKPSNILVGQKLQPVLTDYGISAVSSSGGAVLTRGSYILHCAPETQLTGRICEATDLYQAGITAYRLLNGLGSIADELSEFGREEFDSRKRAGKIPNPSGYKGWVPSSLKKIINKATDPDPSKRFSSAISMLRSFEALNFKGYWIQDAGGNFVGFGDNYQYAVEIIKRLKGFEVVSTQTSKETGRTNKISRFCDRDLTSAQAISRRNAFMQLVVVGGKCN